MCSTQRHLRFISDFRELNKRIKRRPCPIPHVQDLLMNLEGFQFATSLDLNMGCCHLELSAKSKELCTIVLPFGKCECQRTPMGLCNSPDIFQEKMNELFDGLDCVRACIDDLPCLTKGDPTDHPQKLEEIFLRLQAAGLKVNANKSFFAKHEPECLGCWMTREGIKPLPKKVEAILKIDEPRNKKEPRSFIGAANYCRDMWLRRSHILAPLASLTSKNTKWLWGPQQRAAFLMCKRVIAREVMLSCPDCTEPFVIHTDASHHQLGAVISQNNKPIAFYSRKLNDAQSRYFTTERELLSMVETLKEHRNMLLGHEIVYTDHKNLAYKHFNTERVMRWRLLLEEFGPKLIHIKGQDNIVADALSRMRMTEADFSPEAFAVGDNEFPEDYPLSFEQLECEQECCPALQQKLKDKADGHTVEEVEHSNKTCKLATKSGKCIVPPALQRAATEWFHQTLCHPGSTRLELTIGQHCSWKGMRDTIMQVQKACEMCKTQKRIQDPKKGLLEPTIPRIRMWYTLCIDLIGPHTIGKGKKTTHLHALTMIDPASNWFEIAEIPTKRADDVSNILELNWLTRHPWPTEVVMDRGKEFAKEVSAMFKNECGITKKLITTRNPQANSIVERVHKTIHNMLRTTGVKDSGDLDPDCGWHGILAAARRAVNSTVHTTNRATLTQLTFQRDAFLNAGFQADFEYIKDNKQKRVVQNNQAENAKRHPHTCGIGDEVLIILQPNCKHGEDQQDGPCPVTQVHDNGTAQISKPVAKAPFTRRGTFET